ncbi:MAG: YfhO family protein [Pirellulales bacterium]|nr:YfhO family protein [Pirellulales bacterium]
MTPSLAKHGWALAAIIAAWLYYAGPLLSPATNLYASDTFCQDVPLRLYAARQLRAGHFPHWTTDINCGFPLFADGQTGILYPLFPLYVAWPTPEAHDWFMAAHFLLLGGFTYLFLQSIGVTLAAAAIGAITFMCASYHQSNHVVPGCLAAVTWLPLALYLLQRAANGDRRASWWCAIVNAVALLAGHVHVGLISYTLQAAWLAYACWGKSPLRFLQTSLIAFVAPLGLCAVQMWPTQQFLAESDRSSGSLSSALDWEQFSAFGMQWRQLVTFVLPNFAGTPWNWTGLAAESPTAWEETLVLFHGFAAVLLVPLALWRAVPRRSVAFWASLVVLGLLLSGATPLRWLLMHVPPHNLFRWPARYMLFASMGISVLAAYGADVVARWLIAWPALSPSVRRMTLAALVVICGASIAYRHFGPYLVGSDFYAIHSPELVDAARRDEHFRLLPLARPLFRSWRLDEEQLRQNAAFLPVSYNLLFDVPVANLFDQGNAVSPRAMADLILSQKTGALRACAVTHLSSPIPIEELRGDIEAQLQPVPLPNEQEIELIASRPAFVYRLRDARPRAWMVYRTRQIADPEQRVRAISGDDFDVAKEAIVETALPATSPPSEASSVQVQEQENGRLEIETDSPAAGLLVVADAFSPQFHTTLDGEQIPLLRVNHGLRGVWTPAGRHHIVMRFVPRAIWQGAIISLATAILVGWRLWRAGRPVACRPVAVGQSR